MTLTRFVDPRVLARIDNLSLVAKALVTGFVHGLHQSPHLGVSTDFAEHRPYMVGDDIRRIDWRVYGRTDRLYVKEFEAETNANVLLLIDVSASMDFGSDVITKLDYARYLAACLAYFSYQQRDRVGVIGFDQEIVAQVPATGRQLDTVLHTIDQLRPGGSGNLDRPLRRIAQAIRRRSIVVLISDFYEDPEAVRRAVNRLSLKGNDVIAFHLLDPAELDFSFDEPRQFEDLESGDRIPVIPDRIRAGYKGLIENHIGQITQVMGEIGVDYCQVNTSRPLDHALFDYLSRRQRLQRVR